MAIYMNYEGIKGDVSEEDHKEWIPVGSISFAASREANTEVGKGDERQGTQVSVNDISIIKPMDAASPHLFTQSVVGLGKKVKIHITRSGETQQTNYLEIELEKCCVTRYGISTDGVRHNESMTLNFLKISFRYIPVKEDGSPGTAIPVNFNIATGEAG